MLGFYLVMLDTAEEKSKFQQLYFAYRQDMYKTAYRILKNKYDSEDVVHDAFMIVMKKLSKISDIMCPRTHAYLIIIIKNLALKCLEQSRKSESSSDLDYADTVDIEDEVISALEAEQLESILMKLPEDYYNVLFMSMYMELSIKDIAESLDITYENARACSHKTVAFLK